MPGRSIPIVTDEIYHIYNRGIAGQPIFKDKRDFYRFIDILQYYKFKTEKLKYSHYIRLKSDDKNYIINNLKKKNDKSVSLFCYCLMPNHFHILARQMTDKGIEKYLSNVSNSYTRYFNTKYKRSGPIFQGKFKAVRIEHDNQLLHISRYIHLNPYTSYVLKRLDDIEKYQYSSFYEYLSNNESSDIDKELILSSFKNPQSYKKFVLDQAEYQKTLSNIKHLALE